jgi:hypothetical protein
MITYWIYDGGRNVALQQNVDLDKVHFARSTDPDFYLIDEDGPWITVQATNSELMMMKASEVTPEQIIILFAAVRAMKEAARE